jgi:hypothetical protein
MSITGSTVLSGHGAYDAANGFVTLPEGTSLTIFTQPGGQITNALGNAIETGSDLRPFTQEMIGSRSFLPGAPNLTLYPPDGLQLAGNPVTVASPTNLSDIVKAGSGHLEWAACTDGMPCVP